MYYVILVNLEGFTDRSVAHQPGRPQLDLASIGYIDVGLQ
jgi:hypothetical protein